MSDRFPQYTTDYISGVMSLRKPQKKSLEILADILNSITLRKGMNLRGALGSVHAMYPTCSDFEREFLSLTFALATGVGKTRLMGAFIAYLYTQHDIRNYFVVAPNTTIYEKLKKDLSDQNGKKYVFKGLGCFAAAPQIITDDDYRTKSISLFESDIRIFVYNIDKFNKESAKMKKLNEIIGDSFYRYLSNLSDLVLIMDESHHYRAEKGAEALNELRPLLGLELTATPYVRQGTKQVDFKNVVYEYPLSAAIADGYTRTPFALTRSDINFYNFGDEQLDKLMLLDGIACHENVKNALEVYAANNGKERIKPFMLVVCKNTDHANWVEQYVRSDEFKNGAYSGKTIVVHSKKARVESEENMRLLLDVERSDNPVEIVIHVNMLKEGWDVNNLYTIVPLRTATSKILREQMVGRGLRLPYGVRTGDETVDAVMLTAHDKFSEILEEALRGESIFKAGNIIKAEDIKPSEITYSTVALNLPSQDAHEEAYAQTGLRQSPENDAVFAAAQDKIRQAIAQIYREAAPYTDPAQSVRQAAENVSAQLAEDPDLGEIFRNNEYPFSGWIVHEAEKTQAAIQSKFIPIPHIRVTDAGVEEYNFSDFDLDLSEFNHVPISNNILIQNLIDPADLTRVHGETIDFEAYKPGKVILAELRKKPEIDYERCSALIQKLLTQLLTHYETNHGENGMRNIVMMYRRDIANKLYNQMMKHFYCTNGMLQEEVVCLNAQNRAHNYSCNEKTDLFGTYQGNIKSVLFTGIKKGVFEEAKFDSREGELTLARVLERDPDVLKWLRPHPLEFNITYNHGHNYEPDFVVETEDIIYLVEVKGEDKLKDPDVLAKKARAIQYCAVASRWGKANGYKEWRYLFIPSKQVLPNSSFKQLAAQFKEL